MPQSASLPPDLAVEIEALAGAIRDSADEAEALRTVPPALVESLKKAGFFRLWLPPDIGGTLVDFETLLLFVEALSRLDGSIAWTVMIGASGGAFAGYLPDAAMRDVFGDPASVIGGSVVPRGQAVVVDGGYRVSGRWPLASGCLHADWLVANSRVIEDGAPRLLPNGSPEMLGMFAPASACTIVDTWHSPGLRGTGSHDFSMEDVFVPAQRKVPFGPGAPVRRERLYQLPIPVLLGYPIAAVSLGLARASIDAFEALAAAGRTPSRGAAIEVRSRASVQAEVGRAEASLAAARALYYEVAEELWQAAGSDEPSSQALSARRLMAAAHAADTARAVTSSMFLLGGSSSVQAPNLLERCFRDAHAVAQHTAVAPANWEAAGRHFLGLSLE